MNQESFKWEGEQPLSNEATTLEQDIIDKVRLLENKIVKAVNMIKHLREENNDFRAKIIELEDQVKTRDDEILQLQLQEKELENIKQDMDYMMEERNTVRAQVEELLKELDSIELS